MSGRLVENTFLYARSALVTAGVFTVSGDEKNDVVRVLEYFSDVDSHSVDGYRAIAHVMQRRMQYDASEEYALKALALDDPSPRNRFRTYWIQAYNFYYKGWRMNLVAAEEAAKAAEEEEEDDGEEEDTSGATDEEPEATSAGAEQPAEQVNGVSPAGDEAAATTNGTEAAGEEPADGEGPGPILLPGTPFLEQALVLVEKASAILPADWKDDKRYVQAMEGILILKASSLRCLVKIPEALAAYNESRAVQPGKDTMAPITLSAMLNMDQYDVNTNNWESDAVNAKGYFDVLESWTSGERFKWFKWLMEVDYDNGAMAGWALLKCAKSDGERGIKVTIDLYESYLKSVSRTSSKWARVKCDFALFYKLAANDLVKACEHSLEILDVEYSEDDDDELEYLLYNVRQQVCDALFQRFRESSNPQEKLKLFETLKNLPVIKISEDEVQDEINRQSWDNLNESPLLVMQALMTRTVGSSIDFQEMMQKMFKICVDGLSDKVGNNDCFSFRLLAKTLACIPGLEKDAQIALSCQYCITDPDVEHPEEEDSDEEDGANGEENGDEGEAEAGTADTATAEEAASSINGQTPEGNTVTTEVTVQTTKLEIAQPQLADLTNEVTAAVEKMTLNGEAITGQENGDAAGEKTEEEQQKEEDHAVGDLLPDSERGAYCDGTCNFEASDWRDGVMYMCIHCANCDLCEDCYEVCPPAIHTTYKKGEC